MKHFKPVFICTDLCCVCVFVCVCLWACDSVRTSQFKNLLKIYVHPALPPPPAPPQALHVFTASRLFSHLSLFLVCPSSPVLNAVEPFLLLFLQIRALVSGLWSAVLWLGWSVKDARREAEPELSCWKLKGQISLSHCCFMSSRADNSEQRVHFTLDAVNVTRCLFFPLIILTLRQMGENWHAWMHLFKLKRQEIRFLLKKMPLFKKN